LPISISISRLFPRDKQGLPPLKNSTRRPTKGIDVVGTAILRTRPAEGIARKIETRRRRLYFLKDKFREKTASMKKVHFIISGEISSIYKKTERPGKVHNVIVLPILTRRST